MIEIQDIKPDMIANNLEPFEPTHPGELLKDEIEYRNISQRQLATSMGVSYTVLNDIALLCEAALGVPAHILIGLQADYDMQVTKRDKSFLKKLEGIKRIAAVF